MSEPPDDASPTVAQAVGTFVRDYRAEHHIRRDDLARFGSALGMTWGTTSIDNIESGRFAPTLPTLFALCMALSAAAGKADSRDRLRLPDLLQGSERLTIADGYVVSRERFTHFLGSSEVPVPAFDWFDEYTRLLKVFEPKGPTLAERRAAKKLGISVDELQSAAYDLWGESLEQVVSQSVDAEASAQARGHETRARLAEIGAHLERRSRG